MEKTIQQMSHLKISALGIFLILILASMAPSPIFVGNEKDPKKKNRKSARERDRETANSTSYLIKATNINVKAKLLREQINSPYQELKPNLDPSGNTLYFSRYLHPDNTNGVNDYEDIWYTTFNEADQYWTEPRPMASPLNNNGPNFISNVSPTGDTLILGNTYYKKGKMRAGVSYSTKKDGKWSEPKNIHINNDYNLSQHANYFVSLKGVILLSVERDFSLGDRDLYVSFWDGYDATDPISLGDVINTEFEESSPFLASDNRTLYFASKGHDGFGGLDIFVTKRLDDTWTNWTKPKNLGPAVNSKLNEEFFSVSMQGDTGFFSRQISIHNVDLYLIAMESISRDSKAPKHQGL